MKIKIQTTIELSEHDEAALRLYWEEMRDEGETFRDWCKSYFIFSGCAWLDEKIYQYGRFVGEKQRITRAKILKAIGCKHLSLEKVVTCAGTFFRFTYDTHPKLNGKERPEGANWSEKIIHFYQLNHMEFDKWVEYGKDFVRATEGET